MSQEEIQLSFAQQRLWFLDQLLPNPALYNIPVAFRLEGVLKKESLDRALIALITRQEILRTTIIVKDSNPLQIINNKIDFKLKNVDLSNLSDTEQISEVERISQEEINTAFNLSKEYLIRGQLLCLNEFDHVLLLTLHHIIADGWSIGVLYRELSVLYNSYSKGEEPVLSELPIQYLDYILWQREWLQGDVLNKQLSYWKQQLRDIPELLQLPTDKVRPKELNYQGKFYLSRWDNSLLIQLRQLSQQQGVTLFMTLLTAFKILLHRYTGQNHIVVGTPIANRRRSELEGLIGLFVNMLALHTDCSGNPSFQELLHRVKEVSLGAFENQDIPFEQLVEHLQVERELSRNPIFQVMFVFQNTGESLLDLTDLVVKPLHSERRIAKFDLSLAVQESTEGLLVGFEYSTELFKETMIIQMAKHFEQLVRAIIVYPEKLIGQLTLLDDSERQKLLIEWNDTQVDYPKNQCIPELFSLQAAKSSTVTAVIYDKQILNYQELDQKANQLAHYLIELGAKNESLVAISVERSLELIIGILAILKAGAAYVPLDPSYPQERLNFMLSDCRAKILLTQSNFTEQFKDFDGKLFKLDTDWGIVKHKTTTTPEIEIKPENLAYVIYTSGSTGQPKAVGNIHRALINRLIWMQRTYQINIQDCILQKTPFSFDVSVWELLLPLISGAKLIIAKPEIHRDPQELIKLIQTDQVSIIHFVPSMLNAFLEAQNVSECHSLTRVFTSGEPLPLTTEQHFFSQLSDCELHNLYGPTEAAIDVTFWKCYKNNKLGFVPIGRPIANIQTYILDQYQQLCPIGVAGELYLSGVGLARGYLNRPDLTQEKFITNYFSTDPQARLYKTGDLARYLEDGNIQFLGRLDDQVKIRGFRIELGEIESVLSQHELVFANVVMIQKNKAGQQLLVCYVVPTNFIKIKENQNKYIDRLKKYVSAQLPEYMVPSVFIILEAIPLNANGKIDRKVLQKVEFSYNDSYLAPRNEIESIICKVWAEILALPTDKVGIRDNFFRLGGNSILAIRLVNKLNNILARNFSVSIIFKQNTIEKLSYYVGYNKEDIIVIPKIAVSKVEEQLLSFAQERLWFIEKYEEGTNAYNVPMIFKLSATAKINLLEKSLKSIVVRHEILRTLIKEDQEGNTYQLISEQPLVLSKITVSDQAQLNQALTKEANHIYDLSCEYPIRINLYELKTKKNKITLDYYLSIVIHHIAFDGWSVGIFLKELQAYYRFYLDSSKGLTTNLNLPELSMQYKDFALWQRNYLTGEVLDRQLMYWKKKLNGYETLNLITSKPRTNQLDYSGEIIFFKLDETTSTALRELAKEFKVSLYSLLLSAYCLLLKSYSNQDDLIIGTPVTNRHYSNVEHLIGFFVNSLVLRIQINPNTSLKKFIQKVGQEVIEAQLHQDLPFEKLVEALQIAKDTGRHPIFQVVFSVQSFTDGLSDMVNVKSLLEPYDKQDSLYKIAKFDISTYIDDTKTQLKGGFNYAVSLYDRSTVNCLIETYLEILRQFAQLTGNLEKCEEMKIVDLHYLTEENYQKIIYDWNKTDKVYPYEQTIQSLFEDQVESTPSRVAVIYNDKQLTYQELNQQSNQLANYLIQKYEIKPDTLVAICLDRSEQMMITILAILKAGGAYVPIDPDYPDERIRYILEDTGVKLVLINKVYKQKFSQFNKSVKLLAIDSKILKEALSIQLKTNPKTNTKSINLSYVIYTSGTSGKPKGVMIEHKSIVNLKYDLTRRYKLGNNTNNEVVLQFTNYVFDASVEQIVLALLNGYKLLLMSDKLWLDKDQFYNYLIINEVTHIHATPTFLIQYDFSRIISLKRVVCGGEVLSKECYKQIIINKNIEVINEYGPTETSITSVVNVIKDGNLDIGIPISNTNCYVLDTDLIPLPIGAVGELYIGGIGLARGYLNQPELTAEYFIENPLIIQGKEMQNRRERLYKTGDLVCWLPNGHLEYIRRNDLQIKIRGFRIELNEIESALSSYPNIKQSLVVVSEYIDHDRKVKDGKYLVGYYIADMKLNEDAILDYLYNYLPEYMVPTVLVYLKNIPLTANGKLDINALPSPEFIDSNYYGPRNEIENRVCEVWAEILVLPVDKISIRDDFFKLGGDSIVSMQLVSRLRQRLGLNVSVKDIFNYKTIERLYDHVLSKALNSNTEYQPQTEQGILIGEVPLLPIQKYFFENRYVLPNHWNQSFIIKVPNVNINKLQLSIIKLIKHHDVFRLRYKKKKNNSLVTQYYDVHVKPEKLKILDVQTLLEKEKGKELNIKLQKIYTEWQSHFNLEKGPLYSIGYIKGFSDGSARIFFALHHLIVDAVSWRIITKDLYNLYYNHKLGPKGSSYRQWANTLKQYANTYSNEKDYWQKVLFDYDSNNSIFHKLITNKKNKNYINFTLSKLQTQKLLRESHKSYNTQINDLLLTALAYSLSKITQNRVNYITLEGHGREEFINNIDISNTVGWFTILYPVRLEITDEVGASIKQVKEMLRKIPNNGIGYGSLIGYKSGRLPKITFNYLGQFDQDSYTTDFWNIVNEGSGISMHPDNKDHNIIDINGLIISGILQFSIKSKLDKKITEQLSILFKQKIEEIIEHTSNQSRSYLTISDVGNIINQGYLDKLQESQEIAAIYLANSLQQGFIYHSLNQGNVDDAYKVQLLWKYHHDVKVDYLNQAWCYAQKKYPSLRLRFAWEEELVQIIDQKSNLDWRYIDLSEENDIKIQEIKIKQIQEADRLESYDLAQGNLFRVYLIKQQKNLYTCIFSNHHAILDGWSSPILLDYVHEIYLSLVEKKTISSVVDRSYMETQKYLQNNKDNNYAYWSTYVEQIEDHVNLNGLLNANSQQTRVSDYKHITNPKEIRICIKDSLYTALKVLGQKEGVTLNAILQYVWHKILALYGNSQQTVVGTIISGRNLPIDHIEKSVGLFINTLPLVVDHQTHYEKSVINCIKSIQDHINEMNSRSNTNLAKLKKNSERLFDSLFIYENYPNPTKDHKQDQLKLEFIGGVEKLDYPLAIIAYETNYQINFVLKYAGELFDQITMEPLLLLAKILLEQIVQDPNQLVQNLSYLNQVDYQKIIYDWNQTKQIYPQKKLHELFEEQVKINSKNVAVVYKNQFLTYTKLNEQSNQLARHLLAIGMKSGDVIAVKLDRSVELVISLLAIMKAGGIYMPLDNSYPEERLQFMLEDSICKIMITDTDTKVPTPLLVINLNNIKEVLSVYNLNNLGNKALCTEYAYLIYTSGTTGNPKGVINTHIGITNRLLWTLSAYPITKEDSLLQIAAVGFDISVWEIYFPLLAGGRLVIAKPEGHKDPKYLLDLINQEMITFIHFVPSLLNLFLEQPELDNNCTLKQVLTGGEAVAGELRSLFFEKLSAKLYIAYGPTEAAISVTHWDCCSRQYERILPIGRPIANTQIYILNEKLRPLPVNVPGELHIAGTNLALGYLNQPELTREKFIDNPFDLNAKNRLYKTGDRARYLADGTIEFLGRIDHQIKIFGHRIELGEIESTLKKCSIINDCLVIAHQIITKQIRLVAYVIVNHNTIDQSTSVNVLLTEYLTTKLPHFMIPSSFILLDSFPLTVNGKIDRNALPKPEAAPYQKEILAPRNQIETQLVELWMKLLSRPIVSIDDNFFQIGGDSIISIQLVSHARRLGIHFNVKQVFLTPTIASLAAIAEISMSTEQKMVTQGIVTGESLLTPIQYKFFAGEYAQQDYFNQAVMLKVNSKLNAKQLKEALAALLLHHDVLRSRFYHKKEQWIQCYEDANYFNQYESIIFEKHDLSKIKPVLRIKKMEIICNTIQKSIDLINGPIFRIAWFNFGQIEPSRLLIVAHHLVIDAVSWHILLEDLETAYKQVQENKQIILPTKTCSYRDWAIFLRNYANSNEIQQQLDYWLQPKKPNFLMIDNNKEQVTISQTKTYQNFLDKAYTEFLLYEAPSAFKTQINDLLLTALVLSVGDYSQCYEISIMLEGHGREPISDDCNLSRTVGWFTTMFPIKLVVNSPNVTYAIKTVKEQLRNIPNKGIGYGILRYLADKNEKIYKLMKLTEPKISFNYLGQWDNTRVLNKLFTIAPESPGQSVGHESNIAYLLNIECQVINGTLQINWRYSTKHYQDSIIQQLAISYLARLKEVIKYCCDSNHYGYTPSDFPLAKLNQQQLDSIFGSYRYLENIYSLSPMQAGLLFGALYNSSSNAYFVQSILELSGNINETLLKEAWKAVVKQHAILRTGFIWQDLDQPLQYVLKSVDLEWKVDYWQNLDIITQEQHLTQLLKLDRQNVFDLSKAPLMRFQLIHLQDNKAYLIWSQHHLLLDGWCLPIVLNDFLISYGNLVKNIKPTFAYSRPYSDYIYWLQQQNKDQAEKYWYNYLTDFSKPTRLSMKDVISKPNKGYKIFKFSLAESITEQLKKFAQKNQATLNTLIQAAWSIVLSRYTNQDDIVFGVTVSGRSIPLEGIENIVGIFINTLPLRVRLSKNIKVIDLLNQIQASMVEANHYVYLPLSIIQSYGKVSDSKCLFDNIFVFENYPTYSSRKKDFEGLYVRNRPLLVQTEYPLTLEVIPNKQLNFCFSYEEEHFDSNIIKQIARHLQNILTEILLKPDAFLSDIALLAEHEKHYYLVEQNATKTNFGNNQCIHHLFEKQVLKTPKAIAVKFSEQQITYAELNQRATILAYKLNTLGVKPDDLIIIALERSIELVVAILGVLKSGSAYVPLDLYQPNERLHYILQDTKAKILLTQEKFEERFKGMVEYILDIDHLYKFSSKIEKPFSSLVTPQHLAYVIYTSGSTGQPKGVMIEHQSIVNYINWCLKTYPCEVNNGTIIHSSHAFDMSVTGLFVPLLSGKMIQLINEDHDPEALKNFLENNTNKFNFIKLTPSHLKLLTSQLDPKQLVNQTNALIIGGENLVYNDINDWHKAFPETKLFNEYGPTEATVACCVFEIQTIKSGGSVPIGKPISNAKLFILDETLNPVPIGVAGELYIGGETLARGYLNQPELTKARFIIDIFSDDVNARLYKTGDLVRYLPDGNIEFLGRLDDQVKIRGYRVELDEISSILSKNADVKSAVVISRTDIVQGEQYIVAYVVPGEFEPTATELKQYLAEKLPDYMIPLSFVFLSKFPLNANGKLDKKSLPIPDKNKLRDSNYIAPITELDKKLCNIWMSLLTIEKIGINDNFFNLGGHSLSATQLVSRIRQEFKVKMPIKVLFDNPTIYGIAEYIMSAEKENKEAVPLIISRREK